MEKPNNTVGSIISILRSPIAKRKGWTFGAYDCSAWADELESFLRDLEKKPIERND